MEKILANERVFKTKEALLEDIVSESESGKSICFI
jgi:hypothetical protein